MQAQMVVTYKRGDLVEILVAAYGAHNPAALKASKLWRERQGAAKGVTYAANLPTGMTVMAWGSPGRTEVYVESTAGRLRAFSEQVWEEILTQARRRKPKLKPRLHKCELVDEPGDVMASASAGMLQVVRDQVAAPIVTGIATAVVLVVAIVRHASEDFIYGSVTAVAVALLALGYLVYSSRTKKLVWR